MKRRAKRGKGRAKALPTPISREALIEALKGFETEIYKGVEDRMGSQETIQQTRSMHLGCLESNPVQSDTIVNQLCELRDQLRQHIEHVEAFRYRIGLGESAPTAPTPATVNPPDSNYLFDVVRDLKSLANCLQAQANYIASKF